LLNPAQGRAAAQPDIKTKRRWNLFVWAGFALTLFSVLSYFLFFIRFPATRDVPWVTFLLFLPAAGLLWAGLRRAFDAPERYRGRISGPVLSVLSLLLAALFCWFDFALSKDLPSGSSAVKVGRQAPDFTLPDANGKPVALADLLKHNRAVLLIFYRGYW
jgi:hypothetical protein